MRKLSLCFILLAVSTMTFAGCGDNSKPIPKKPDATKPADETTPATDVDKPADTPADPAVPAK